MPKPKFDLGQLLSTPGALSTLEEISMVPLDLIKRHAQGDWGDLGEEDKEFNEQALIDGSRIFSKYDLPNSGESLYVITEAKDDQGKRSATTVLRPDEY